jgi:hypothetical protein
MACGLGNPRDSRLGSLRYKKSANNFGMHRQAWGRNLGYDGSYGNYGSYENYGNIYSASRRGTRPIALACPSDTTMAFDATARG